MLNIFFALFSLSMSANAQLRMQPITGNLEFRGQFDYSTTVANYPIGGGASDSIGGGQKLQRANLSAEGGYSLNDNMRGWAGFSGGQTTANVINSALTTPTTTVTETHTNSGINEGWLGAQYWLIHNGISIVPQLDLVFPFWRVNTSSNDPLLGEGAMRIQAGSWLMFDVAGFTPFVYGGYAYRDEGRAGLIPYDIGVRYTLPQKFWGQLEFRGYETMTDDTSSGFIGRFDRTVYLTRIHGNSQDLYSINPSRAEIAATAGMQLGHIGLYVGGWLSVFGRNSADAWGTTVGVTFDSELGRKKKRTRNRFNESTEQYDESVFEDEVTPPAIDEPIYEEPAPAPAAQPKKAAPPRKRRADEPMPNVEMLMKDTQKTLEKRGP